MKSFCASLLVFLLLFILILWNRHLVCQGADSLEALLSDPSPIKYSGARLTQLEAEWHRWEGVLCFSVNYVELDKLDECVLRMRAAFDTRDEGEWEAARLLALESVRHIRELERITAKNLL